MFFNMRGKKFHGVILFAILISAIFLFSYFRLKPIYFQTVGYTFDQGRDFLKAAEIVLYKNPTFIGPTTGIMGIYHGAWWYYMLAVAFFIFNGLPSGFYYFNFLIQFLTFAAVLIFAWKRFDMLTQIILALLIATSPYLIFNNILLANNVMAMPPFLLLLLITVLLLEKKFEITIAKRKINLPLFFLAGLFLGFTAEFEFAFGLLLIPTYLLALFVFNVLTRSFYKIAHYLYFFIGLGIAFIPRILFEIKNNFGQTKTLTSFITNPKYFTPRPFRDIFNDRVSLFDGYYGGIFIDDVMKILISLVLIFFAWMIVSKRKKVSIPFVFFITLGVLLFLISLLYKDTFWHYYYDGIQYLFLLIIGYILSAQIKPLQTIQNVLRTTIIAVFVVFIAIKLNNDISSKPIFDGMQVQEAVVKYIQREEQDTSNYCVRVYTPPVIPYTYDYLFLYSQVKNDIPTPSREWQNDRCWFILEHDDYAERKQKWLDANISKRGERISSKLIKDVRVELWSSK